MRDARGISSYYTSSFSLMTSTLYTSSTDVIHTMTYLQFFRIDVDVVHIAEVFDDLAVQKLHRRIEMEAADRPARFA